MSKCKKIRSEAIASSSKTKKPRVPNLVESWERSSDGPRPFLLLHCDRTLLEPNPVLSVSEQFPERFHAMAEHLVTHDKWLGDFDEKECEKWWGIAYLFPKPQQNWKIWSSAIAVTSDNVDQLEACYGTCLQDKLVHEHDLDTSPYDLEQGQKYEFRIWTMDLDFGIDKVFFPFSQLRHIYLRNPILHTCSSGLMSDYVANETVTMTHCILIDIYGALCDLAFAVEEAHDGQFAQEIVYLIVNYAIPSHFFSPHRSPRSVKERYRFWFRG